MKERQDTADKMGSNLSRRDYLGTLSAWYLPCFAGTHARQRREPSGGPHPTEKNGTGGAAAAAEKKRGTSCAAFPPRRPARPDHALMLILAHQNPSRHIESARCSESYRPATTATLRYQLLVPSFSVEFVRRLLGSPSGKKIHHPKTHQRGGDAREGGGGSADAHGWGSLRAE